VVKKALNSVELKTSKNIVEKVKRDIAKAKKVSPSILLDAFLKEGTTGVQMHTIFQHAKKAAPQALNDAVYLHLIEAFIKSEKVDFTLTIFNHIKKLVEGKVAVSSEVLMRLFSAVTGRKLDEHAFMILEWMNNLGDKPNAKQYAQVIELYAEKNMHKQVFQKLNYMDAHGVQPDAYTYSCILRHYARIAPVEELENIKTRMQSEGLLITKTVYWNLMEAYARYDQREKTIEMFEAARHESVAPYTSMIRCYGKWGEQEKARKIFDEMKDDLHTTGFTPGVISYNALTQAYALNNKFEEAFQLMEITRKDKTKYNEDTWNILVENAIKFSNWQALIDTCLRMKKLRTHCSRALERKTLEKFKENDIDFPREQKQKYWTLWNDIKFYES